MNTTRTLIGSPDPDDRGHIIITTMGTGGAGAVFPTGGGAAGADRYGADMAGAGGVGYGPTRVSGGGAGSATATPGPLVVAFAQQHGPELTDWQRDVVDLAYRSGDDVRPAQRPHKRRRRPLVGVSVRWGRCVAYGGVGGVLVGLIVGLR